MNASFTESTNKSFNTSRSSVGRSSIRRNVTKKMFVNNITSHIYDLRNKELRLRQKEIILNAREQELLERESLLLEKERNLIKRQMDIQDSQHKIVLENTYSSVGDSISPRTRSITLEQLDSIESELESSQSTEDSTQTEKISLKPKKTTKIFSFLKFKKSKSSKTQNTVNKLVRDILVSDEQENWTAALEMLSKMATKKRTTKN